MDLIDLQEKCTFHDVVTLPHFIIQQLKDHLSKNAGEMQKVSFFEMPFTPRNQYLPLCLKDVHFDREIYSLLVCANFVESITLENVYRILHQGTWQFFEESSGGYVATVITSSYNVKIGIHTHQ